MANVSVSTHADWKDSFVRVEGVLLTNQGNNTERTATCTSRVSIRMCCGVKIITAILLTG